MRLSNLVGSLFYASKQNQKQLDELYRMAEADGIVHPSEQELFEQLAKKYKISGAILQKIQNHQIDFGDVSPPKDEQIRFEHFYEMVSMIIVDGKVAWEEMEVCKGFAAYLQYEEENVEELIQAVASNIQHGSSVAEAKKRVDRLL